MIRFIEMNWQYPQKNITWKVQNVSSLHKRSTLEITTLNGQELGKRNSPSLIHNSFQQTRQRQIEYFRGAFSTLSNIYDTSFGEIVNGFQSFFSLTRNMYHKCLT